MAGGFVRIAIVASNMPHHIEHAQAMAEGLSKHNVDSVICPEGVPVAEETVICWGWRIGRPFRDMGKNVLVMERGYIDRMDWTSLGWNGLNGRASRPWAHSGEERILAHHPRAVRRWGAVGRSALIIGQVSGDEAVRGVDMQGWYSMATAKCYELGFELVKFRPHPVATQYGQKDDVNGVFYDYAPLSASLADAAIVVTFSSNTGVEAMLAGKPVIACDAGSMAWPIAMQNFDSVKTLEPSGRRHWAAHLAWSQFSLNEIRSGFAWDVVKDSQTLQ